MRAANRDSVPRTEHETRRRWHALLAGLLRPTATLCGVLLGCVLAFSAIPLAWSVAGPLGLALLFFLGPVFFLGTPVLSSALHAWLAETIDARLHRVNSSGEDGSEEPFAQSVPYAARRDPHSP